MRGGEGVTRAGQDMGKGRMLACTRSSTWVTCSCAGMLARSPILPTPCLPSVYTCWHIPELKEWREAGLSRPLPHIGCLASCTSSPHTAAALAARQGTTSPRSRPPPPHPPSPRPLPVPPAPLTLDACLDVVQSSLVLGAQHLGPALCGGALLGLVDLAVHVAYGAFQQPEQLLLITQPGGQGRQGGVGECVWRLLAGRLCSCRLMC